MEGSSSFSFTLALAGPTDAAELARLMRGAYRSFGEAAPPDADVERFFREALAPGSSFEALLARAGRDAIGLATLAYAPTTQSVGRFAWLDDLHVVERARGRGVGRALLDAAIARAAERGAHEVRLSAERDARLLSLHESAGFRPSDLALLSVRLPR